MSSQSNTAVSILAQALALDAGAISTETGIGVTPQWDSMAHMRLILALEQHLGRQLPADDMLSISCLNDIKAILSTSNQPA